MIRKSLQYAFSTFPIVHLISPKSLHDLCLSFILSISAVPRKIENNAYAIFFFLVGGGGGAGAANGGHYGKCVSGVN